MRHVDSRHTSIAHTIAYTSIFYEQGMCRGRMCVRWYRPSPVRAGSVNDD